MVLASRVLSLLSASLWVLSLTTPVLDSRDKDGISMVQTALGGTESGLKADWPLFAALGAAVILCALSAWIGRSRRWALAALIVAAVWGVVLWHMIDTAPFALWDGMDAQGRPTGGMVVAEPAAGAALWGAGIVALGLAGLLRLAVRRPQATRAD